jgi:hypothetical protein
MEKFIFLKMCKILALLAKWFHPLPFFVHTTSVTEKWTWKNDLPPLTMIHLLFYLKQFLTWIINLLI